MGRASSLTWVPAGKKTLPQVPVVSVAVKVQPIPAGWEVTRPPPVPPLASETLPLVAWNWVVTVRVADLVASPEVPMMVDDCGFASELVVTVKVAAVDPAGTVTLPGTVAAVVLLLDSETTTPPAGAEEVNETVPVTGVPPTTVVWLRVSAASDGVVDGGGCDAWAAFGAAGVDGTAGADVGRPFPSMDDARIVFGAAPCNGQ